MGRRAEEPYIVVPNRSGFWPYKVVAASDPNTALLVEHEKKCKKVADLMNLAYRTGRSAGNRFTA